MRRDIPQRHIGTDQCLAFLICVDAAHKGSSCLLSVKESLLTSDQLAHLTSGSSMRLTNTGDAVDRAPSAACYFAMACRHQCCLHNDDHVHLSMLPSCKFGLAVFDLTHQCCVCVIARRGLRSTQMSAQSAEGPVHLVDLKSAVCVSDLSRLDSMAGLD